MPFLSVVDIKMCCPYTPWKYIGSTALKNGARASHPCPYIWISDSLIDSIINRVNATSQDIVRDIEWYPFFIYLPSTLAFIEKAIAIELDVCHLYFFKFTGVFNTSNHPSRIIVLLIQGEVNFRYPFSVIMFLMAFSTSLWSSIFFFVKSMYSIPYYLWRGG